MNEWMPIAVAIVAFAVISGALRRHFAPLRGERRTTKKGAAFEVIATAVNPRKIHADREKKLPKPVYDLGAAGNYEM
jgi:hypothetical protein